MNSTRVSAPARCFQSGAVAARWAVANVTEPASPGASPGSLRRRRRDAAGDAGHHLEGHARRAQRQRLLPAAPEDERVASLERDHLRPSRAWAPAPR